MSGEAMFVMAQCGACQRLMTFNPYRVPSIKGQPICHACVEVWQKAHPDKPFVIPEGAYEPVSDETEWDAEARAVSPSDADEAAEWAIDAARSKAEGPDE